MKQSRFIYIALTAVLFSGCSFQPNPSSPSEPVIEPQANFYRRFGGALDINPSANVNLPSLALDSSGNPVVSWYEYDGTSFNIYVKRWNGSSWVQLGTFLDANTNQFAFNPSLALNSSGNPVVSWEEYDGTSYNIYVKRWNGSSWVQLGGILDANTNREAYSPSLALDSSGNPVVSWTELDGTSFNVYVKQWNGTSWQQIPGVFDIVQANGASSPSLALDSANNPVVAWQESDNIYVKGYYENAFKLFGSALDAGISNDATAASITKDNHNRPVVAWSETSTSADIFVSRWTGTAWSKIALSPDNFIFFDASEPSLAVEKSTNVNAYNPVVAFSEVVSTGNSNIYVKRWNGTAWVNYSNSNPLDKVSSNNAYEPSLALDSTNKPYVAWTESSNVYIKRWTGTAWAWVGGSAGLKVNPAGNAFQPSLAIGTDNKPVIAWGEEDASVNANIYVKRLVGNTWTLVGTTAIDKSIANYAIAPSLDLDSSNNPIVSWEEQLAGNSNIYAKRWNGSSWVSLGDILDKVSSRPTSSPTLSIGTNNNPVVAWSEFDLSGSDSYDIYVKRWTGTAWQSVSTGAIDVNLSNNVYSPSMVLNSSNNPIVAWSEYTGISNGDNIFVKGF